MIVVRNRISWSFITFSNAITLWSHEDLGWHWKWSLVNWSSCCDRHLWFAYYIFITIICLISWRCPLMTDSLLYSLKSLLTKPNSSIRRLKLLDTFLLFHAICLTLKLTIFSFLAINALPIQCENSHSSALVSLNSLLKLFRFGFLSLSMIIIILIWISCLICISLAACNWIYRILLMASRSTATGSA